MWPIALTECARVLEHTALIGSGGVGGDASSSSSPAASSTPSKQTKLQAGAATAAVGSSVSAGDHSEARLALAACKMIDAAALLLPSHFGAAFEWQFVRDAFAPCADHQPGSSALSSSSAASSAKTSLSQSDSASASGPAAVPSARVNSDGRLVAPSEAAIERGVTDFTPHLETLAAAAAVAFAGPSRALFVARARTQAAAFAVRMHQPPEHQLAALGADVNAIVSDFDAAMAALSVADHGDDDDDDTTFSHPAFTAAPPSAPLPVSIFSRMNASRASSARSRASSRASAIADVDLVLAPHRHSIFSGVAVRPLLGAAGATDPEWRAAVDLAAAASSDSSSHGGHGSGSGSGTGIARGRGDSASVRAAAVRFHAHASRRQWLMALPHAAPDVDALERLVMDDFLEAPAAV